MSRSADMALFAAPAMPARFRFRIDWPQVPVYGWLALIVLIPNLLLIGTSFLSVAGGRIKFEPTLANYVRLWHSAGFWRLLEQTFQFSLLGAFLGALVAYPMAYFVGRVVRNNRSILTVLVLVPLWISLLMRVFSWRLILGQNGVLNSSLVSSGLLDGPSSAFLYTGSSVVLTFAYISIPFIFVSTLNAFEKIPQSLIEASQDLAATTFQTFCHVIWPLTRRSLAIGFSLAFLVTVGDYVTPSMVGGINGTTLGVLISSQFGIASNWPFGAALSIALIVAVSIVVALVLWSCPQRGIFSGDEAPSSGPPPTAGEGHRLGFIGGATLYGVVVAFLYAPLLLMVVFSFNDSTLQAFPLQALTFKWYAELAGNSGLIAAGQRSLIVAVCVVIISSIVGTAFALVLHYRNLLYSRAIELLLTLPLAMPSVVLGIVMVLGTEIVGVPPGLARVVIGQASFIMPITMLLVLTRLRRLDPSLLEASLDLGASRLQSFLLIVLPLIRGAAIGGMLLGLTLSADEVMVTLFLAGPSQTLPIWVFNQMRFGFTPSVNAVFTLLGLFALSTVLIGQVIARRRAVET
ncbi:ABC transporter permease subunit [Mesorhizobium sp.]|jgi:spermidine/putrescine transport system permease protein|uniref:ABC transporter permease subunit n=1 Tax=Mesorhizobium sp. TaxID=1871066 RepID=UPI00356413F0